MTSLTALQRDGITTTLYPWESRLAEWVGEGRNTENTLKGDRMSYDPKRLMSDNWLANVHAASTEIGVSRLIGAFCYAAVWDRKDHATYANQLPDALWGKTEVEIKWRRSAMAVPVDIKDVERGRLLLWAESKLAEKYNCVCPACHDPIPTHTRVRLLGGGWAEHLWELGETYNGDQHRRKVDARHLTPITELLSEVPPPSRRMA